jgi:hypothetical protein
MQKRKGTGIGKGKEKKKEKRNPSHCIGLGFVNVGQVNHVD